MRAGLSSCEPVFFGLVKCREMSDSVAVVHTFVAREAAVIAARPGDDGVLLIGSI
jgi:hypothetical protein